MSNMTFTKQKIYYIIWDDHWNLMNTWQNEENLDENPIEVHSIGWCMKDGEKMLHLASTIDSSNHSFGGHMAIMKKSIKEAWELTNV